MTKAITLHQPWATLIALGVKTIETRSWKPPKALIGERLLIHAGQRDPRWGSVGVYRFDRDTDGVSILWNDEHVDGRVPRPAVLPRGAIVASAILTDAVPMVDAFDLPWPHERNLRIYPEDLFLVTRATTGVDDVSDQRPYGDFAPGRWAWLLEDVKPTTERCPACWGTGWLCDQHRRGACNDCHDLDSSLGGCPICTPAGGYDGSGRSEPIPAKGKQGLWNWEPT